MAIVFFVWVYLDLKAYLLLVALALEHLGYIPIH